jgi:hypothetical protein
MENALGCLGTVLSRAYVPSVVDILICFSYDKTEGQCHVIDPKAMSKEELYGSMDPNTREWKDGLFTHILRKIIDNVRGESQKRQWIIFDGDVDPEWVENLVNSGSCTILENG